MTERYLVLTIGGMPREFIARPNGDGFPQLVDIQGNVHQVGSTFEEGAGILASMFAPDEEKRLAMRRAELEVRKQLA
jgi:hypothetical protein